MIVNEAEKPVRQIIQEDAVIVTNWDDEFIRQRLEMLASRRKNEKVRAALEGCGIKVTAPAEDQKGRK